MSLQAEARFTAAAARAEMERWPQVYCVPRARVRALVAERILRHAVRHLPVRVVLPGGRVHGAGDCEAPTLTVHRPQAFLRRLGAHGLIGFGESYQAGDWDADDLPALLAVFGARLDALVPTALQRLRHLYVARRPRTDRNTRIGSRRNIARHYDLFHRRADEGSACRASGFWLRSPIMSRCASDSPGGHTSSRAQLRQHDPQSGRREADAVCHSGP